MGFGLEDIALTVISPVAELVHLVLGEDPDADTTELEDSSTQIQKHITDTLITNQSSVVTDITQTQFNENITNSGLITCEDCAIGLDLSQHMDAVVTAQATLNSSANVEIQSAFTQSSDKVIDAMVDVHREFLSPEDRRKYSLKMKTDMDQTTETYFTTENLSNVFAYYSGSQGNKHVIIPPMTMKCVNPAPPGVTTKCVDMSQHMSLQLTAMAIINQNFDEMSKMDGYQALIDRMKLDYKYTATGPIGEWMRGIAGILSSILMPLAIVGGVILVILIIMMFTGNKSVQYKNLKVGTPTAVPNKV